MAMTKAEKAKMDALVQKVRLLGALRWTSPVPPDVLPPKDAPHDAFTTGFIATGGWYDSPRVSEAWSKCHSHGTGSEPKDKWGVGSRYSRAMHSTKVLALKAKRHEIERECAKVLAEYDKLIEKLELESQLDSTK